LKSIELNASSKGSNPESTRKSYTISINQYIEFINSHKDVDEEITPQDLIDEARKDKRLAQMKMRHFFIWLQGDDAKEEEKREIRDYSAR